MLKSINIAAFSSVVHSPGWMDHSWVLPLFDKGAFPEVHLEGAEALDHFRRHAIFALASAENTPPSAVRMLLERAHAPVDGVESVTWRQAVFTSTHRGMTWREVKVEVVLPGDPTTTAAGHWDRRAGPQQAKAFFQRWLQRLHPDLA